METNVTIQDIRQLIQEDWSNSACHQRLCLTVVDYLVSRKFQDVQHLTHSSFVKLLGTEVNDTALLEVLRYLNGSRINVLATNYELIDDEEEAYVLSKSDVKTVLTEGVLTHPKTGDLVPSPEDKVFLFFSPSERLKNLQQK